MNKVKKEMQLQLRSQWHRNGITILRHLGEGLIILIPAGEKLLAGGFVF